MLVNKENEEGKSLLFIKLRKSVYRFIQKRVKNREDVEELTQEVLYRGYRTFEKNSEGLEIINEEDIHKYFSQIAINEVRRFYKNQPTNLADIPEKELLKIPANNLSAEKGLLFLDNLANLPFKQRLIYFLESELLMKTFLSLFSKKTVAVTLGISEEILENLASKIPMSDGQIKEIIELLMATDLKTSVRDERWKSKKFLNRIFNRN